MNFPLIKIKKIPLALQGLIGGILTLASKVEQISLMLNFSDETISYILYMILFIVATILSTILYIVPLSIFGFVFGTGVIVVLLGFPDRKVEESKAT
eukprot:UN03853